MAAAEENTAPPTEWLVTFADMMSLLLTFFILLVSLNELKQEKRNDQYQAMLNSLRHQFGETRATAPVAPREERKQAPPDAARARRQHTMNSAPAIRPVSEGAGDATSPSTGGPFRTGGTLWFEPAETRLASAGETSLRRIVNVVEGKPQKIEVRGYTSFATLPDDVAFRDPWELAYQRARQVADRLIEMGIKSRRIRLGIAVANQASNAAAESTAPPPHDRVDVFLLDEFTDEIVETTQAQDAPQGNRFSR
ncbi:MAG: OmpA family protein [Pirellulales bacterium]|nr:OmpA family protein [Pirellulales bacterium]